MHPPEYGPDKDNNNIKLCQDFLHKINVMISFQTKDVGSNIIVWVRTDF